MRVSEEAAVDLSIYPRLVEIIGSFPTAQYARALALLGIPDALAKGPRYASDLASAVGAHEGTLTRYLRALTMLGLVTEDEPNKFGMTPMGALLQSDSMFHSLTRATAGMHHYLPYTKVVECIRTGKSMAEDTLGSTFYDYLEQRPDELLYFYQLISVTCGDVGTVVAKAYDFSRYDTIVDVSGHFGQTLVQILQAVPDVNAVLYDTPGILPAARGYFEQQGLSDRIELKGGEIELERPPAGHDLYMLNTVLWESDDERCLRILRNIAKSMRPDSKLLIVENFLPPLPCESDEEPDKQAQELHRVNFSVFLQRGGRVRKEEEYRSLLQDAGFVVEDVTGVQGNPRYWDVIEARLA